MVRKGKSADKGRGNPSMEVVFVCELKPEAKDVYVAGTFNGWDPQADRMRRRNDKFQKKMRLAPGEYQYKFVVDGEWYADPAAEVQVPNECGTTNSVVQV